MRTFKVVLDIWRQKNASDPGRFVRFEVVTNEHMSFLEMMDVLNQDLIAKGQEPVAFDNDCREGVCGMCGFVINGSPHGKVHGGTVCQLHMRHFRDGEVLRLEPWRAKAFPVVRDLVVNRSAFDRVIRAGGCFSTRTGSAPDANAIASAALFTSAKIAHLGLLPQGEPERLERVVKMTNQAMTEGFGHCTLMGECAAVCPAHVPLEVIPRMNKDFIAAATRRRPPKAATGT
jgi:succinate dehydrogenase / fumarate reductase iron-sulfur subunit